MNSSTSPIKTLSDSLILAEELKSTSKAPSTAHNTLDQNNKINSFIADINTKINNKFRSLLTNKALCPILQQALEYTILSSGKKLRPALVYAVVADLMCSARHIEPGASQKDLGSTTEMTHGLTPSDQQLLLNTACALELIHTYSIVHDDLPSMDNDDLRRGQPTCHKKFNEATAILTGDTLQSLAFELLSDCYNLEKKSPSELIKQIKISSIISQAVGHKGMVAGQSLELNQAAEYVMLLHQDPVERLNIIHHLKTGKLFTACLQSGSIIANTDSEIYSLITKLGESLGLAFQIQDDILDCYQNTKQLGKPAKSDAERNLPTYSNIMGLTQAEAILEQQWRQCADIIKKLPINPDCSILSLLINKIKTRVY